MSGKSEKKLRRMTRKIYAVNSQEWMTEIQMEPLSHRILICLAIIGKQKSGIGMTVFKYLGSFILIIVLAFAGGYFI